jgi:DNA-binding NtrC family response regulator
MTPKPDGKYHLLRNRGWMKAQVRVHHHTLREIAAIVGCNRSTVREYLRTYGIEPTTRP